MATCFNPNVNHFQANYYYYRYSALGPVWAETRAQSVDWYSSGTLHPGQVLRGSLPLLSPFQANILYKINYKCVFNLYVDIMTSQSIL